MSMFNESQCIRIPIADIEHKRKLYIAAQKLYSFDTKFRYACFRILKYS